MVTEYQAFSTEHANDPKLWSVDSFCNVHLTPFKNCFFNCRSYAVEDHVKGLKGQVGAALETGSIELEYSNAARHTVHDVLYVPNSQRSLLSLAKLMQPDQFERQRHEPRNFYMISVKLGIKLPGCTINDLFHIWEPKSAPVALITTRSMGPLQLNCPTNHKGSCLAAETEVPMRMEARNPEGGAKPKPPVKFAEAP